MADSLAQIQPPPLRSSSFLARRLQSSMIVGATGVVCFGALAAFRLADAPAALICAFLVGASTVGGIVFKRRNPAAADSGTTQSREAPPFALMLDHLTDPILLVSGSNANDFGDRRFLFANAAARGLLRLQRDEGPLTTAVRAPEILAAVEEALFGGVPAQANWHSHGVLERFWQARVTPLQQDNPAMVAGSAGPRLALLTLKDETEVRRIESTRADFLANASHELRTPLASLAGFVETLRGHAKDDSAARDKFLAIMQVQAERMRHLIDDLMSLSRIELSEHIRPSGQVDLAATVTDVIEALSPQAADREVTFETDFPLKGTALTIGDRDQIVQVAQNLVENAVKYTAPGGKVWIEIQSNVDARAAVAPRKADNAHLSLLTPDRATEHRYITLRVRDAGAGIARNHFPRLTERFYRVEGQKARDRPGTGLGLAIVKHIINRHRGGVTVESTPGVGSVFTIYIPMAELNGNET